MIGAAALANIKPQIRVLRTALYPMLRRRKIAGRSRFVTRLRRQLSAIEQHLIGPCNELKDLWTPLTSPLASSGINHQGPICQFNFKATARCGHW